MPLEAWKEFNMKKEKFAEQTPHLTFRGRIETIFARLTKNVNFSPAKMGLLLAGVLSLAVAGCTREGNANGNNVNVTANIGPVLNPATNAAYTDEELAELVETHLMTCLTQHNHVSHTPGQDPTPTGLAHYNCINETINTDPALKGKGAYYGATFGYDWNGNPEKIRYVKTYVRDLDIPTAQSVGDGYADDFINLRDEICMSIAGVPAGTQMAENGAFIANNQFGREVDRF